MTDDEKVKLARNLLAGHTCDKCWWRGRFTDVCLYNSGGKEVNSKALPEIGSCAYWRDINYWILKARMKK